MAEEIAEGIRRRVDGAAFNVGDDDTSDGGSHVIDGAGYAELGAVTAEAGSAVALSGRVAVNTGSKKNSGKGRSFTGASEFDCTT